MFRTPRSLALLLFVLLAGLPALAQRWEVSVTNLTEGQVITPPLVVLHQPGFELFTAGDAAPDALVPLAEGGATAPLIEALAADPAVVATAAGDGPILPGHTGRIVIEGAGGRLAISAVGMLATTNDAFFAALSLPVPPPRIRGLGLGVVGGSYFAPAWDAGSEADTESCEEIPGPPCGNGGVRHPEGAEGFVAIHSGIHGHGDLAPELHGWNNPVALIRIRPLP